MVISKQADLRAIEIKYNKNDTTFKVEYFGEILGEVVNSFTWFTQCEKCISIYWNWS